ncbi:hypothetical protein MKW98_030417 [Papaver atlanticum]|uniref:Uncharacterized protein n=1 Tax=Papaver atlanticum TaxID=357466 RepID=A0AAD4SR36_9MAGN|nr:hypothetical protein MKW98_030417 [Papaver atlanticum]
MLVVLQPVCLSSSSVVVNSMRRHIPPLPRSTVKIIHPRRGQQIQETATEVRSSHKTSPRCSLVTTSISLETVEAISHHCFSTRLEFILCWLKQELEVIVAEVQLDHPVLLVLQLCQDVFMADVGLGEVLAELHQVLAQVL